MSEKSKAERLSETITLLKKLPTTGVPETTYAYCRVKTVMSKWVKEGLPTSETIDFVTHWGELTLPVVEGKSASLQLKLK
jgi:hypothetical protein